MRNQEYFDKADDNAKLIYLGLLEVADTISVATQEIKETIITEDFKNETD